MADDRDLEQVRADIDAIDQEIQSLLKPRALEIDLPAPARLGGHVRAHRQGRKRQRQ